MRTLVVVLLAAMTTGCASTSSNRDAHAGGANVDEAQVLEIARATILDRGNWPDVELGKPERQRDGSWRVPADRKPARISSNCVVIIDRHGNVTKILPGL